MTLRNFSCDTAEKLRERYGVEIERAPSPVGPPIGYRSAGGTPVVTGELLAPSSGARISVNRKPPPLDSN